MTETKRNSSWLWWTAFVLGVVVVAGVLVGYILTRNSTAAPAHAHNTSADDDEQEIAPNIPKVRVVRPVSGGTEHITQQPGTVQAFESAPIIAEVSGYLKELRVDIGSRVKEGDILAVIDVPDLKKTAERNKAAYEQQLARVKQMQAQVKVANAEVDAAKAAEIQAAATLRSNEAWARFRHLQMNRMERLFKNTSIEEKLLDEAKERYEASEETVRSSQAAIKTTLAQRQAKEAAVEKAEEDVKAARAEAEVAQAEWQRSLVLVNFATLKAPFDGIVTVRNVNRGDFIRAAATGANSPLVVVEREDLMRVVVQIPDRDVNFTDKGDKATVELDALPGQKFEGKVARTAGSEDQHTRLMRIEIDLPNPTGRIKQGMFGQVTIILEKSDDPMTIPTAALVGETKGNRGQVFVVRDGKAVQVPVELGVSYGGRVGVRNGLTLQDEVIANPGRNLHNGTAVEVEPGSRKA